MLFGFCCWGNFKMDLRYGPRNWFWKRLEWFSYLCLIHIARTWTAQFDIESNKAMLDCGEILLMIVYAGVKLISVWYACRICDVIDYFNRHYFGFKLVGNVYTGHKQFMYTVCLDMDRIYVYFWHLNMQIRICICCCHVNGHTLNGFQSM